jgi:hypothetical protein
MEGGVDAMRFVVVKQASVDRGEPRKNDGIAEKEKEDQRFERMHGPRGSGGAV